MSTITAGDPHEALPRRRRRLAVLAIAVVIGWTAFTVLIAQMYAQTPPGAGFDLELLLTGARRVAEGVSPYEPAMLAGQSVGITTLFYSYPPLVAQAMSPLAAIPSVLVLVALLVIAPLATAAVVAEIARAGHAVLTRRETSLLTLALLPFWFPFTLALLFGNLDALFAAFYGLVLLAVLPPRASRSAVVAAGVALAAATLTKLHPAVLGVWLLARGAREWRRRDVGRHPDLVLHRSVPRSWAIALVAVVVGVLALAISLLLGGIGPWADYVAVLRASTVVDLLDGRNLGPSVQAALLLGLDASTLAPMQLVVVGVALATAAGSALVVDDPLESLLWAAMLSLLVLPVTWFHHFAVLVPFGAAALARGSGLGTRVRRLLIGLAALGFAVAALGFGTVAAWLLVPIVVAMARLSRPGDRANRVDDQVVASASAVG